MDDRGARALIELNNTFYRENASSFSETRSAPWQGWQEVARTFCRECPEGRAAGDPVRILDMACGNQRLASFLESALPHRDIVYCGVDSCDAFPATASQASRHMRRDYIQLDALQAALDGAQQRLERIAAHGNYDLSCCFGFMHHIPGFTLRLRILRSLIELTKPGGLIAVSYWQFMRDPRLARKARETTALAMRERLLPQEAACALEDGDWLLGWQDSPRSLRYCHSFTDSEVDALISELPAGLAAEICRFSADGKTGDLNRYIMLRRA